MFMCPMRLSSRKPTNSWSWNYGGRGDVNSFEGCFMMFLEDWGTATAEETGEMCHQICAVKKTERWGTWVGGLHPETSQPEILMASASAFKRTGWHIKCFHPWRLLRRTQTPRNFKRAWYSTPPGDHSKNIKKYDQIPKLKCLFIMRTLDSQKGCPIF